MNQPLPITASIEIAAPLEHVWAIVSDVTRMSEWSPECRRIFVVGSPKSGVGTRLLGLNKRGWAVWPTLSKVVRFEPGRAVAWKVRESAATWAYELQPTAAGTVLTGRRDLAAFSALTRLAARSSVAPKATIRSSAKASVPLWSGSGRRSSVRSACPAADRSLVRGAGAPPAGFRGEATVAGRATLRRRARPSLSGHRRRAIAPAPSGGPAAR